MAEVATGAAAGAAAGSAAGPYGAAAGAVIGAIGSLIGGSMANDANRDLANRSNVQNWAMMRDQQSYEERMSSTAYMRATADMKAAGLNPMLAYQQGGASTPSASAGNAVTARMEDVLSKGVSSAIEGRRLAKELDATDSQIALNDAAKTSALEQGKLNAANAKTAGISAEALEAQLPAIKTKAKLEEKTNKINEKMLPYDAIMNRVQQATGVINNAASAIKPKIQVGGGGTKTKEIIIDKSTGEILHQNMR